MDKTDQSLYRWKAYDANDERTWPKVSGMYVYKSHGNRVGETYYANPRTVINEYWEAQNVSHYLVKVEADQQELWKQTIPFFLQTCADYEGGNITEKVIERLMEKFTLIPKQ